MALKRTLTTEEHAALPEGMRPLYVQNGDGFRLDAEPDDGAELKRALENERQTSKKRQEQLDALSKRFDGIDPDKAKKLLSDAEALEREKLKAQGDFESREKQLLDKHQAELAERDKRLTELQRRVRNTELERAARAALAEHGGSPALLLPTVKSALDVVEAEDGTLQVVVLGADGKPRISTQPGNAGPMTPGEYVASLMTLDDYKPGFRTNAGSGSGSGAAASVTQSPGGATGVKAAKEMSIAEKSDFISKHGYDAWTQKVSAGQ